MKISTFTRHVREGTLSMVRNGWMTFASISSISISLFILGAFLLLTSNVNYLSKQIESQVEIRVFLDVNVPEATVASLRSSIEGLPDVASVTFISKEEGLKIMREKLGESGKAYLEGLDGDNNPLNDSFTVEVKEPRLVAETAAQINALNPNKDPKPIVKVNYGQGTVETMFKVTSIIRYIGYVLVLSLGLTAMFLIANTIKLTILARNREIKIMKMVGATNGFIRWPFFIEGAFLGFLGSVIPLGILLYGYWELLRSTKGNLETMLVHLKPLHEVYTNLSILLLGIGIAIGILGTTFSIRKFLKV